MPSIFTVKIKDLKEAIKSLEEPNLLIPEESRFKKVLQECTMLLEKHNHIVKLVPKVGHTVTNTRELVKHFYIYLERKHSDIVPYKVEMVDLSIAKEFLNNIMELTGFESNVALGFCAELIKTVFDFENEFNFKPGSLINFRIFGQKEMSWVTEKAIQIYNREKENEAALVKEADSETIQYEKTHPELKFGFADLDELVKNLKEK